MADAIATSFGVLNYSGMLFNKGNVRTPLLPLSEAGRKPRTMSSLSLVRNTVLAVTVPSLKSVKPLL